MSRFIRYLQLPADERRLCIEAVFWVSLARLALVTLPFRWIAPRLGRHMGESAEALSDTGRQRVHQVSRAVKRASRHVQRDRNCLIGASLYRPQRQIKPELVQIKSVKTPPKLVEICYRQFKITL